MRRHRGAQSLNMNLRGILTIIVVLWQAVDIAQGLHCWSCNNERSVDDCHQNGAPVECPSDQEMVCETEYRKAGATISVISGCKQKLACYNNQDRNVPECEGGTDEDGHCYYCCETDDCNSNLNAVLEGTAIGAGDPCDSSPKVVAPVFVSCEFNPPQSKKVNNCTFTCKFGYKIVGNDKTECIVREEGSPPNWGDHIPQCLPIVCPKFVVDNGNATCSGTSNCTLLEEHSADTDCNMVHDTCTTTCNDGYELVGNRVITCTLPGDTAIWTPNIPTCEPIPECNSPPPLPFSSNNCTNGKQEIGTICKYSCLPNYDQEGDQYSECIVRGGVAVWSDFRASCTLSVCTEDLYVPNGRISCDNNAHTVGTVCSVTCDNGYKINGTATTTCQKQGGSASWTSWTASCTVMKCPSVPPIPNGISTCSDNAHPIGTICSATCNSGYKRSGSATITCRIQGGVAAWESWAVTCRVETCPSVPSIPNGSSTCTDNAHPIGTTCTATCNSGYTSTGSNTIHCQNRGGRAVWESWAFACTIKTCPEVPPVPNAISTCTNNSHPIGTVCSATCKSGYKSSGSTTITCRDQGGAAAWESWAVTCTIMNCPSVPAIPNGISTCSDNAHPIGTICTATCNSGYTRSGSSTITCQNQGGNAAWESWAAKCTITNCPSVPPIPNGRSTCSDNAHPIGTTCNATCNSGYTRSGSSTITCQNQGGNASWESWAVKCAIMTCDNEPTLAANVVANCSTNRNVWQGSCKFSCSPGYELFGASETHCILRNGRAEWRQTDTTCVRSPPTICPEITNPPHNGAVSCNTRDFAAGTVCTFTCDSGYELIGSKSTTCRAHQSGAAWEHWETTCNILTCDTDPPSPTHGTKNCSTNRNVDQGYCEYSCENGYNLNGNSMTWCRMSGGVAIWSGVTPTCEKITPTACSFPNQPENGYVYNCNTSTLVIGTRCNFMCFDGYEINGALYTECRLRNGEAYWAPPTPTCDILRCPEVPDFKGEGSMVCYGDRVVNEAYCRFSCDEGREMSGAAVVRCVMSGGKAVWNRNPPTCREEPKVCEPSPVGPDNGEMTCTGNNVVGRGRCVFSCLSGFQLIGATETSCVMIGGRAAWDNLPPICVRVPQECNSLPSSPVNGRIFCDPNAPEIGSSCRFICSEGYVINGASSTTCVRRGNGAAWDAVTPQCVPGRCEELPRFTERGGMFCYGEHVVGVAYCEFYCGGGLILVGSNVTRCIMRGGRAVWSDSPPECRPSDDPTPPPPPGCSEDPVTPMNGGMSCVGGLALGARCDFSCRNGYALVGARYTECIMENGRAKWSNESPVCTIQRCERLPPFTSRGGMFCTGEHVVNVATCEFNCGAGLILVGSNVTHCVMRGGKAVWSHSPPTCETTRQCAGRPLEPTNGGISCSGGLAIGARCDFLCDSGYRRTGSTFTECVWQGGTATWSNPPPICTRTDFKCPNSPIDPENGRAVCSRNLVVGQARCNFSCFAGYSLEGSSVLRCVMKNGRPGWDGRPPKCKRTGKDCSDDPTPPDNGYVICSTNRRAGEATCEVKCIPGYQISGSSRATCEMRGGSATWVFTTPPRCVIIPPTECSSLPDSPNNGGMRCDRNAPSVGSRCQFYCDARYTLDGSAATQCVLRGNVAVWDQSTPQCAKDVIKCDDWPEFLDVGGMICTGGLIVDVASCTFSCPGGSDLIGSEVIRCIMRGGRAVWSDDPPQCAARVPTECSELPASPMNGGVTCSSGLAIGARCVFMCSSGYTMQGASSTECVLLDGTATWSNPPPVCSRAPSRCSTYPRTPENGFSRCAGDLSIGTRCDFSCAPGYRREGSAFTQCVENGGSAVWNNEPPVCRRLRCTTSPLKPRNGDVACSENLAVNVGRCVFTCEDGYKREGSLATRCVMKNGRPGWSNAPPKCNRQAECSNDPARPANGDVSCSSNRLVGEASCVFTCSPGYRLSGSSTATCVMRGGRARWNILVTPSCTRNTPTECDFLPDSPDNGGYNCDRNAPEVGSTCRFFCIGGYVLQGSAVATCVVRSNVAVWNVNTPRCTRNKRCDSLPEFSSQGSMTCTGERIVNQATCNFICADGLQMDGSDVTRCIMRGGRAVWSNDPPECKSGGDEPIECSEFPTGPNNGEVACLAGRAIGARCEFSCSANYKMQGASYTECVSQDGVATWSNPPPLCLISSCSEFPATPANGYSRCSGDLSVGTRCDFSCDSGYKRYGSAFTVCVMSGGSAIWNNEPPVCRVSRCPTSPIDPSYGRVTCSGNLVVGAALCVFTCSPGYKREGPRVLRCVMKDGQPGWDSRPPKCSKTVQECSTTPLRPDNGIVKCTANRRAGEGSCDFSCIPGYQLSGSSRATCEIIGGRATWNIAITPTCTIITPTECPLLPNSPNNGGYNCDRNAPDVGSTCRFFCTTGYSLDGSAITECVLTGNVAAWNADTPTCEPMRCANLPEFSGGSMNCVGDRIVNEAYCEFSCAAGLDLIGSDVARCIMRGGTAVWSNDPPSCEQSGPPDCTSYPLAPTNGDMTCTGGLAVGARCQFSCRSGYTMQGKEFTVCVSQGRLSTWSNEAPTCVISECTDDPRKPLNGDVKCTRNRRVGEASCVFGCTSGYRMVGQGRTQCVMRGGKATWDGNSPRCQRLRECRSLPLKPQHGTYTCSGNGRTVGTRCQFSCNTGYNRNGASDTECVLRNGRTFWNRKSPTCTIELCPLIPTAQNRISSCTGSRVPGQGRCTFTCTGGFQLEGSETINCTTSGGNVVWDSEPPSCKRNKSPIRGCDSQLPKLLHGTVSCSGSVTNGDIICTFECNGRYELVGVETNTCSVRNGVAVWTSDMPVCRKMEERCNGFPNSPSNGARTCDSALPILGTVCQFSCNPGYYIDGSSTATCNMVGSTASWSAITPMCRIITTSSPPTTTPSAQCRSRPRTPQYGRYNCNRGGRTVGTKCQFSCNSGYTRRGASETECVMSNGRTFWNRRSPTCMMRLCPPVPTAQNRRSSCTGGRVPGRGRCSFTCTNGFQLENPRTINCIATGGNAVWDNEPPVCRRQRNPTDACESELPILLYGTVSCSEPDASGRIICRFACTGQYELFGVEMNTCTVRNGVAVWTSEMPVCKFIDQEKRCSELPLGPVYGSRDCVGTGDVGTICIFKCDPGYAIDGLTSTTCVLSGGEAIWNSSIPTCIPIVTPTPTINPWDPRGCRPVANISNGRTLCSETGGVPVCRFSCDERFVLIGEERIVCIVFGQVRYWSTGPPICIPVQTPVEGCFALPPAPEHGSLACQGNGSIGTACKFFCNPPHRLVGPKVTQCVLRQGEAMWDMSAPTCLPTDREPDRGDGNCERITEPENSEVICGRQGGATVCRFLCNPGFVRRGPSVIMCPYLGRPVWSSRPPLCRSPGEPPIPQPWGEGGVSPWGIGGSVPEGEREG